MGKYVRNKLRRLWRWEAGNLHPVETLKGRGKTTIVCMYIHICTSAPHAEDIRESFDRTYLVTGAHFDWSEYTNSSAVICRDRCLPTPVLLDNWPPSGATKFAISRVVVLTIWYCASAKSELWYAPATSSKVFSREASYGTGTRV